MVPYSDGVSSGHTRDPERLATNASLCWVDPCKINLISGVTREEKKRLLQMEGEVLDGDWDKSLGYGVERLDVFEALRDRLVLGEDWRSTSFFKRVIGEISSGARKWHCRTEGEFLARCEALEGLYGEIKARGYKTQAELESEKLADEIRVGIQRDGRFIFLDGRHRLSIARLLGLPKIPVRAVVRHAKWEAFRAEVTEYANAHGGRVYEAIDHPDLSDIPSQHGGDRIELLRAAFDDYDCHGKRLLDVGTHWGYMCQQMEKLGFVCVGIEGNAKHASFAERIRVATEARFTIWRGNLLDYPDVSSHDVLVALNIFHHLIKTEPLHELLVAFLRRLKAEMILFQPHVSDPPGQMVGAFRNYNPIEFVQFVAYHSGMRTVTPLGKARDGRPLFKLTR